MKKADLIIILSVLVVAGVFFGINKYNEKKAAGDVLYAEINIDGELYKKINLQDKREVVIEDHGVNIINVNMGTVEMTYSDCPDQVCVKVGKISKPGESIVCLPNKVYVEIVGEEEGEIDAISE